MKRWLVAPLLLIVLALTACAETTPTSTPPPAATPTPTPAPNATPEPIVLTVWLPDWMILDNPDAADVLEDAIAQFESRYGARIDLIIKPDSGPGGLFDSLEKTKAAAPAILPDLMVLPNQQIAAAANEGFLQPLHDLVSQQIFDDLYPFAREVGLISDSWLALPFAADFEHLAFQPAALSDPPVSWTVVLESNAGYAFPTSSPETTLTDALLVHYLSAVGEGADPVRNEAALFQTLAFYESALSRGLIDERTVQAARPAETWPRALQGDVPLAHTTTHLWLNSQEQAATLRFGPIPTADSNPRYLANGWSYVIVTADAGKQNVLARLLEAFMEPDVLASWSSGANRLPARRAAMTLWPATNYTAFTSEALEIATDRPSWLQDLTFTRALHRAMQDVLTGQANAQTATQTAVAAW